MVEHIYVKGVAVSIVENNKAIDALHRFSKLVSQRDCVLSIRFVELVAPGKRSTDDTLNTALTNV